MHPNGVLLLCTVLLFAAMCAAWTPSECPQDCVRPAAWWLEHRPGVGYYWPQSAELFLLGCNNRTWLEVTLSSATDAWTTLAKQYIAAQLNVLSFSCIETLPQTANVLSEALQVLSNDTCSIDDASALALSLALEQFNAGNVDVATCLCPACSTCAAPETCTPFSCTAQVINECCALSTTPLPTTTTPLPTTTAPLPTTTTPLPTTTAPSTTTPLPTTTAPPTTGSRDLSVPSDTTAPPTTPSCGCTFTQGYWKNHPSAWGAESGFALCGISALTILKTPSKNGDAFVILARQYIAARLNSLLDGACFSEPLVNESYLAGEALLTSACKQPSGWNAFDANAIDAAVQYAMALDLFNNGKLGPAHCGDTNDNQTQLDDTNASLANLRLAVQRDTSAGATLSLYVGVMLLVLASVVIMF